MQQQPKKIMIRETNYIQKKNQFRGTVALSRTPCLKVLQSIWYQSILKTIGFVLWHVKFAYYWTDILANKTALDLDLSSSQELTISNSHTLKKILSK